MAMRLKEFEHGALAYAAGHASINCMDTTIKNLSAAGEGLASFVQLIALKPLASESQLLQAADQTINAFLDKSNFVNQPGLEFLLRVSGRKQLAAALDLLQVREGFNDCVLMACAAGGPNAAKRAFQAACKSLSFVEEPGLLAESARRNQAFLLQAYGLNKDALKVASLEQLVNEKIALVSLES